MDAVECSRDGKSEMDAAQCGRDGKCVMVRWLRHSVVETARVG